VQVERAGVSRPLGKGGKQMNLQWFKEIVDNWPIELTQEISHMCAENLIHITRLHGGVTLNPSDVPDEIQKQHAQSICINALNSFSRKYAHSLRRGSLRPHTLSKRSSNEKTLPFVSASRLIERVELNSATHYALEALPGIGPKTSKRIVELRRQKGRFKRVRDLLAVEGIGQRELKKFSNLVYISPRHTCNIELSSKAIKQFVKSPCFENYLQLLTEHIVGPWGRNIKGDNFSLEERVAFEVLNYRHTLESNRIRRRFWDWGVTEFDVRSRASIKEKATELRSKAVEINADGVLLDDSMYSPFVEKLISVASETIRIVMFFARFETAESYPTSPLFAALVSARKRGCDIKVILDRDDGKSGVPSGEINKAAYNFLRDNDIDVVFDSEEKFTHTKLIIVDATHVVLGSHNWTAGSFYAYQDTSVYLKSSELVATYLNRFNLLWEQYSQ